MMTMSQGHPFCRVRTIVLLLLVATRESHYALSQGSYWQPASILSNKAGSSFLYSIIPSVFSTLTALPSVSQWLTTCHPRSLSCPFTNLVNSTKKLCAGRQPLHHGQGFCNRIVILVLLHPLSKSTDLGSVASSYWQNHRVHIRWLAATSEWLVQQTHWWSHWTGQPSKPWLATHFLPKKLSGAGCKMIWHISHNQPPDPLGIWAGQSQWLTYFQSFLSSMSACEKAATLTTVPPHDSKSSANSNGVPCTIPVNEVGLDSLELSPSQRT